jgi:hypothetical protein
VGTTLVVTLVTVAAITFFFTIIGVFGLLPALAALALFIAIACVVATRPQRLDDAP